MKITTKKSQSPTSKSFPRSIFRYRLIGTENHDLGNAGVGPATPDPTKHARAAPEADGAPAGPRQRGSYTGSHRAATGGSRQGGIRLGDLLPAPQYSLMKTSTNSKLGRSPVASTSWPSQWVTFPNQTPRWVVTWRLLQGVLWPPWLPLRSGHHHHYHHRVVYEASLG